MFGFPKSKPLPEVPTVEAEPERRVIDGVLQEKRLMEGFGEVWVNIPQEQADG